MTPKTKLAELTSAEAREHLDENAVILLPMGSLEDQGTHAPMGDYLAAEAVAIEIAKGARAAGVPTFVAPVIPFGGWDSFGSSYGGIALSQTTLAAVLDDMLNSLTSRGLKKLLIINGHGGNVATIADVTLRWRQKTGLFVPSMYLWQIAYELLKQLLGPERAVQSAGHGADPLTSVGLFLYPDLFRLELINTPGKGRQVKGLSVADFSTISYDGARFQAPVEVNEAAPHGVWGGDPNYCSPETGAALVERLAQIGTGIIRDHISKGFPE
jgi:creatinine amidohydrolase